MPTSWSFDAIDAKHKPKRVELECTQCGGTNRVEPRAINGNDMILCANCNFEMICMGDV